mmetsp:Transcript_18888/g.37119  ORF Transcript_18888/g.37119 Transcript_18888/m.37119 type:complete len:101 (-) Transcript_18888:98-400(-)
MEGIEPSASMSDELQSRIGRIALEAKQRNPNGYSLTPPRLKTSSLNPRGSQSASSGLVKPKFTPFVTASGQHIVFHDDAVNVPASCIRTVEKRLQFSEVL